MKTPKPAIVIEVRLRMDEYGFWYGELAWPFRPKGVRVMTTCFGPWDHFESWIRNFVHENRNFRHAALEELNAQRELEKDATTETGAGHVAQDSGGAD